MTTHHIEIRPRISTDDDLLAEWQILTRSPLGQREASELAARVSRDWEVRVVQVRRMAATDAELLERIGAVMDVAAKDLARAKRGNLPATALVPYLRSFLFGAMECLGDSPPVFEKWRAEDHTVKHKRTCGRKDHGVAWKVGPMAELEGAPWLAASELGRRAAHINDHTIPALGIEAVMSVEPARVHLGMCASCGASSLAVSIVCQITWGEHVMRREYDLGNLGGR